MECPQISVLRQRRMVLYFLNYLEFLDETFGEYKLHIEDANTLRLIIGKNTQLFHTLPGQKYYNSNNILVYANIQGFYQDNKICRLLNMAIYTIC